MDHRSAFRSLGIFRFSVVALVMAIPLDCVGQPPVDPPTDAAQPTDPPPKSSKERPLEYWVDQLGSPQFLRRETATRKLSAGGTKAVPILLDAIKTGDLESTERAIQVLRKIALDQSPSDESGAWQALNALVATGTGSRRAGARSAIDEIWRVRDEQAREVLRNGGVFVGIDDFATGPLTSQVVMVRIDEHWKGDLETLQWLRWLRDIENIAIGGKAIDVNVLDQVVKMPDVNTIALVEGDLTIETLKPLTTMKRLNALEIRYIRLQPDVVDAIAKLPIRESLNLMGTGVKLERVQLMRNYLPGLAISHRQGGFLGVTCNTFGVAECRIRNVIDDSAAHKAGLRADDVIIGIDDAKVERFSDLQEEINQHLPGDEIAIKFLRHGTENNVKLELGKYRDQ